MAVPHQRTPPRKQPRGLSKSPRRTKAITSSVREPRDTLRVDQEELSGELLPVLIEFDTVYYYQMANLNDRSACKGSFKTV